MHNKLPFSPKRLATPHFNRNVFSGTFNGNHVRFTHIQLFPEAHCSKFNAMMLLRNLFVIFIPIKLSEL